MSTYSIASRELIPLAIVAQKRGRASAVAAMSVDGEVTPGSYQAGTVVGGDGYLTVQGEAMPSLAIEPARWTGNEAAYVVTHRSAALFENLTGSESDGEGHDWSCRRLRLDLPGGAVMSNRQRWTVLGHLVWGLSLCGGTLASLDYRHPHLILVGREHGGMYSAMAVRPVRPFARSNGQDYSANLIEKALETARSYRLAEPVLAVFLYPDDGGTYLVSLAGVSPSGVAADALPPVCELVWDDHPMAGIVAQLIEDGRAEGEPVRAVAPAPEPRPAAELTVRDYSCVNNHAIAHLSSGVDLVLGRSCEHFERRRHRPGVDEYAMALRFSFTQPLPGDAAEHRHHARNRNEADREQRRQQALAQAQHLARRTGAGDQVTTEAGHPPVTEVGLTLERRGQLTPTLRALLQTMAGMDAVEINYLFIAVRDNAGDPASVAGSPVTDHAALERFLTHLGALSQPERIYVVSTLLPALIVSVREDAAFYTPEVQAAVEGLVEWATQRRGQPPMPQGADPDARYFPPPGWSGGAEPAPPPTGLDLHGERGMIFPDGGESGSQPAPPISGETGSTS